MLLKNLRKKFKHIYQRVDFFEKAKKEGDSGCCLKMEGGVSI